MNYPKLIKESEWVQILNPIELKKSAEIIQKSYFVPGFMEAGLHISEALVNAKLKKRHIMRVTIQVLVVENE